MSVGQGESAFPTRSTEPSGRCVFQLRSGPARPFDALRAYHRQTSDRDQEHGGGFRHLCGGGTQQGSENERAVIPASTLKVLPPEATPAGYLTAANWQ